MTRIDWLRACVWIALPALGVACWIGVLTVAIMLAGG